MNTDTDGTSKLPVFPPQRIAQLLMRWWNYPEFYGNEWKDDSLFGNWFTEDPLATWFDYSEATNRTYWVNPDVEIIMFTVDGINKDWLFTLIADDQISLLTCITAFKTLAYSGSTSSQCFDWVNANCAGKYASMMWWAVWRMWQLRLAEQVQDLFSYRQRDGAGNFTNHPHRGR